MRLLLILGLSTIVCAANLTNAQEPDPKKDPSEIRKLIDQLVSPNPKPITGDEDERVAPRFKLPDGFDKAKQKLVHAARAELSKIGPAAFPYLIERWDDQRYCITMSVGINGYCFNASVGQVCRDIIYDQLQPYGIWPITEDDPRGKPKRPAYPFEFLNEAKDAANWWEVHKDKSLYEMQLMIINWVVDQEGKKPDDFTKEERSEVQRIRADLIKAKKPMKRGKYLGNDTLALSKTFSSFSDDFSLLDRPFCVRSLWFFCFPSYLNNGYTPQSRYDSP